MNVNREGEKEMLIRILLAIVALMPLQSNLVFAESCGNMISLSVSGNSDSGTVSPVPLPVTYNPQNLPNLRIYSIGVFDTRVTNSTNKTPISISEKPTKSEFIRSPRKRIVRMERPVTLPTWKPTFMLKSPIKTRMEVGNILVESIPDLLP
jgi:hypothetical protein